MIVLVGMPGSGKSSAGRQVARRFGLPFIDSDHLIESDIGMPIKDYFAQQGEQAFRDLETATLRRIAEDPRQCVLSTGGGSVLVDAQSASSAFGGVLAIGAAGTAGGVGASAPS